MCQELDNTYSSSFSCVNIEGRVNLKYVTSSLNFDRVNSKVQNCNTFSIFGFNKYVILFNSEIINILFSMQVMKYITYINLCLYFEESALVISV